jgi:hypothetical protein
MSPSLKTVPQYTGKIGFIEYLSILPENGNNPRSQLGMA